MSEHIFKSEFVVTFLPVWAKHVIRHLPLSRLLLFTPYYFLIFYMDVNGSASPFPLHFLRLMGRRKVRIRGKYAYWAASRMVARLEIFQNDEASRPNNSNDSGVSRPRASVEPFQVCELRDFCQSMWGPQTAVAMNFLLSIRYVRLTRASTACHLPQQS